MLMLLLEEVAEVQEAMMIHIKDKVDPEVNAREVLIMTTAMFHIIIHPLEVVEVQEVDLYRHINQNAV